MKKGGEKGFLQKFWFLLWKDDSLKGWLFSIIFLFVFIKFIFFPVLGLATGTSLPLAIVESCSMYHDNNIFSNFDSWWTRHDVKYGAISITKEDFEQSPLQNGFGKGDILLVTKANPEKLKVGDIIIFTAGTQNPIIHRIIKINETPTGKIFSTEGDNNNGQLSFEDRITENQLIGKATLRIVPYGGWIKLIFYEFQKPENERGFCDEN